MQTFYLGIAFALKRIVYWRCLRFIERIGADYTQSRAWF